MNFKNKLVLVAGLARSGTASARLLYEAGARLALYDQKGIEAHKAAIEALADTGADWRLAVTPDEALRGVEAMVLSPGIPLTNPLVVSAKASGIPIIGELELGYRLSKGKIIAITGTNGKTTTTELTGEILRNNGKLVHVAGNIGLPFTSLAASTKPDDYSVLEVSSFQLETIDKFHPTISCILNISEDHLERHGSIEDYTAIKSLIFKNQSHDDVVVLNWDDLRLRALADNVCARVVWFSRLETPPFGAFISDGNIVFGNAKQAKTLCMVDDVRIPGAHNLENALAASAITFALDVPPPVIRHSLRTFPGVEHRVETVDEVGGVRYINDSKGTNVDSTLKAIACMNRPTVIMLGGSYKKMDYLPLAAAVKASPFIEKAVVIGETGDEIAAALDSAGFAAYERASGFDEAFSAAARAASRGWNVLLSPACASFDMFRDFEYRGRHFKHLVSALKTEAEA